MRKRTRKNKRKNQRNIIIISVICLTFTLITAYSAFSTKLSITAKGNTIDKSRTIQSWSETSNEDFHSNFYKENIVTATFLDTAKVPENAVEDWDVSVNKDRGVMAYVTESQTETGKYDLFIGAKNGVIANEDSGYLFYNFAGLTNINFNNEYDTSNVMNMSFMFTLCTSLSTIDVSSFNTSNVTDISWMFAMYDGVTAKDSKLTKIIGIENLNTSNVTNMSSVFRYDLHLGDRLNLSNWDVSKTTNMSNLFDCLYSIKYLDISSWDTSNVINMQGMFLCMESIEELNLCSFDTAKVTNMTELFRGISNLKKVKVGSYWTTTNATTDNMFLDSGVSNVTTGEC